MRDKESVLFALHSRFDNVLVFFIYVLSSLFKPTQDAILPLLVSKYKEIVLKSKFRKDFWSGKTYIFINKM